MHSQNVSPILYIDLVCVSEFQFYKAINGFGPCQVSDLHLYCVYSSSKETTTKNYLRH